MLKNILFVVSALALARAQIPSIGSCPDYVPMANFDMGKFLGGWYVAESYFQILDPISRCVMANYTQGMDGKYRVSNQVTNRFTGIKRVVDGEIRAPTTKAEEGKLHVKYTALPLTPETEYAILETDYDSFAVLWSCSKVGPFNAQNAWVMTRAHRAEGPVLQKAYGVLDKYKISKNYFIKTNQDDCALPDEVTTAKPAEAPSATVVTESSAPDKKEEIKVRSSTLSEEKAAEEEKIAQSLIEEPEKVAEEIATPSEVAIEVSSEETKKSDEPKNAEETVSVPPSTVPEVILKAADRAKEIVKKAVDEVKAFEPIKVITETFEKPAEKIQEALASPVGAIQGALAKPIEQIKETFEKPYEQIKETLQGPSDRIKEVLNGLAPKKTENPSAEPTESKETIVEEKETSEKNDS